MSDDYTQYGLRRGSCRRKRCSCQECNDDDGGGATVNTGASIMQRTIIPANMTLLDNQEGINIIIAKLANANQILCQFQGFTGEMTKTVTALTINLNLEDPPAFVIANMVALVTDGEAQPGLLKFGGPCSIRLYKLRGYQGGASRRFLNRNNQDQCSVVFRRGEEVSMQGNSTSWIGRQWRRR